MITWLWFLIVPLLLGKGILRVIYGASDSRNYNWEDTLLAGFCMQIGLVEAAHLLAVFFKLSLRMVSYLWAGTAVILSAAVLLLLLRAKSLRGKDRRGLVEHEKERLRRAALHEDYSAVQQTLLFAFGISVLLQIVIILTRKGFYQAGDITLETVRSFLTAGSVYQVHPLTGNPLVLGMPLRIRILSLPTMYASLCCLFGGSPDEVVGKIVPAVVLLLSYCAWDKLGGLLLGRDRTRRLIFLVTVSLFVWLGNSAVVSDGFQLMYCGYRGTAVRAGILLPYTIYACLRKKWCLGVLCVLAEACVVWTLYGMGACLLTMALFAALHLLGRGKKGQGGARV